jgi:hypothetical protein
MYSPKRRFRLFRLFAPPVYTSADGGTKTISGTTTYHTFTTNGTFDVTVASDPVSYLVVGGGGGGGDRHGGGGGAGGVLSGTFIPTVRTYAITVGLGGAGGNHELLTPFGGNGGLGLRGGDSIIATIATALGGGGGGTYEVANPAGSFGSGGGGGGQDYTGSAGTAGQGNAGGNGLNPGGGGGGGAGAAGANANVSTGGIGTSAFSTHLLAVGYGTTFATTPNTPISGGIAYIGGGGGGGADSSNAPYWKHGGNPKHWRWRRSNTSRPRPTIGRTKRWFRLGCPVV